MTKRSKLPRSSLPTRYKRESRDYVNFATQRAVSIVIANPFVDINVDENAAAGNVRRQLTRIQQAIARALAAPENPGDMETEKHSPSDCPGAPVSMARDPRLSSLA